MIIKWKTPFTAFMAVWRLIWANLKNDNVLLDNRTIDRRIGACETCFYYENEQCALCTCYVNVKAILATEDCPIGRWPKP
jgi:hypothetical protein